MAIHPLTGAPRKNGKPRQQLYEFLGNGRKLPGRINALYDAAQTTDEFKNYWANADTFDADSANRRSVREKLVPRSRYEIGNNGYADGIAQTYATDMVGIGPQLRMQSGSPGFNAMVEFQWTLWVKATLFRRKLWCMAHAKHSDGESFGIARTNPRGKHPVTLDVRLYETEQCQTPLLPFDQDTGYIDGIRFDDFGNPLWYDILQVHPGSERAWMPDQTPERVPAEFVLHWFKLRRPGQHRGIPECASTLNTGASARRWREATVAAAETAADFTAMIKTAFAPDEIEAITPMSTFDIQKRMMMALPDGFDIQQMRSEHPNATYEAFHKTLINEQARPKSMPYNKAACDSSSYNYASGRLDHQTYYAALDVEREDCNDLVLDPLFTIWFDEAVRVFGWLGGNPDAISPSGKNHLWDWPKHRVVDVEAEANANDKRLRNGSTTISRLYSECGWDFEDEIQTMATDYGVSVDEMRKILLKTIFAGAGIAAQPQQEVPDGQTQDET